MEIVLIVKVIMEGYKLRLEDHVCSGPPHDSRGVNLYMIRNHGV